MCPGVRRWVPSGKCYLPVSPTALVVDNSTCRSSTVGSRTQDYCLDCLPITTASRTTTSTPTTVHSHIPLPIHPFV
jgi:hypothetical protein